MTQRYDFDLFTIGAGSGGVAASRRAGSYGARVAICEARRVGGTCVLRGCVPKKLLVYASHVRDEIEDARGFGWTIGEAHLDWGKLIEAKNKELDRLNGIYVRMLRDSGVEIVEGRARLVDEHTVDVGGKRITANHILIATGSYPVRPDIPGADLGICSDQALDLPSLPKRALIVGGGYIAVEFAGILSAAGVEVTLLVRGDNILRGFDADVRSTLSEEMRKRGVNILCETLMRSVERENDCMSVRLAGGEILETDLILFATGRVPCTTGLGLEETGVKLNERGAIVVDASSRTSVPSIFAVGDVTDRINLTPVAIAEGRAVAESLFNNNPMQADHENVPSAVFSNPPVGSVGLSEGEARRKYGKIVVYRARFRPMKHTLSGREERTMMKLVVERSSGRVLGAHMVGPDAPEIIQGVAIAIKCGATKRQFDATIGIHPTAAEEFVTMRDPVPEPEADPLDQE
ncbi:glutathione-disulfide reductase [Polyangium aurulentum]|uniref:glutathione-disulfide reductase n=1 Tax=Polyangium aurulentum TaxID=2567896 RepID=UPI0010AE0C7A|nr:glutathione-disulfide reductase [Polyangium aurulentum]UQA60929.1 glutathione-disulfide reductase [Polyangium aurulentum]